MEYHVCACGAVYTAWDLRTDCGSSGQPRQRNHVIPLCTMVRWDTTDFCIGAESQNYAQVFISTLVYVVFSKRLLRH